MSNIKSRKYYEDYSIDQISKIDSPYRFLTKITKIKTPVEDQLKERDDEFRTLSWAELYKTAANFYDNPDTERRNNMFKFIRANFSAILSETESPNDLPLVHNRNSLLLWTCQKNNEFLGKRNSSQKVECNVESLLQAYGPDVKATEEYLGSYKYSI